MEVDLLKMGKGKKGRGGRQRELESDPGMICIGTSSPQ